MSVSRETEQRLADYEKLLLRWNGAINLVSPSTLSEFRSRHVEDCLQVFDIAVPQTGLWVDLGSGGGLPGMVIAISCSERPVNFTLVESDQRKAAFLRSVARELKLPKVKVVSDRIESIKPLDADFISARALAPLPRLMAYLDRHLAPQGQAWLMKGEQWPQEVDAARQKWSFTYQAFPSITQPGAAILKVSGLAHA